MARWLRQLFWITVLAAVLGVVMYVQFAPLPAHDLPSPTRFLDREGREIPTAHTQNRIIISQDQMPQHLRDAFVAIEDYRFYRHFGLDPIGIARAFWKNLEAGRIVEGGSTITQQLAKNLYLNPERTLARKLREVVLTLQLEAHYSKDEILTMYLNQIYFGHGAYGVEAAARTYFGKSARDLTLAESALLAGIPRAPARYSPFLDWDAAVTRQHLVLDRMAELGYISEKQAEAAKAEKIRLSGRNPPVARSQYFIDYVALELEKKYPQLAGRLKSGGLTVYTTLNRRLQETAERVLEAGLPPGAPDENGVTQPQGALVAMDPTTGYILAMVGGRNYQETQYNRATALRQPGSAFKPFVYLAALENGYLLADTIMCEEVEFQIPGEPEPYRPTDYGSEPYHNRPLTLREALVISDNVVSVILNYRLGPEVGISYARRLGIESALHPYLSSVLGTSEVTPLELTRAFCALANGGKRVEPIAVLKVTDAQGQTLLENRPTPRQVVNPAAAYLITDVLKGVLEPGGTAANIGWKINRPAAGKTGTSQDYTNAWFVGYTPDLVATVWVGRDKASESVGGSGARLAAPIWADFIQQALAGAPKLDFSRPENVVEVKICTESGLKAGWWCPKDKVTTELFIRGTEPWRLCNVHSPLDWHWLDRVLPPQWNRPQTTPNSPPPVPKQPARPHLPRQVEEKSEMTRPVEEQGEPQREPPKKPQEEPQGQSQEKPQGKPQEEPGKVLPEEGLPAGREEAPPPGSGEEPGQQQEGITESIPESGVPPAPASEEGEQLEETTPTLEKQQEEAREP